MASNRISELLLKPTRTPEEEQELQRLKKQEASGATLAPPVPPTTSTSESISLSQKVRGNPSAPPKQDEADALFNKLESRIKAYEDSNPQFPQETSKGLREALKKAYEDRISRAEWQDVAQLVGNALVRFGAAQSGMQSGRDMSQIPLSSYDYSRDKDRALQEYKVGLGEAAEQDKAAEDKFRTEESKRRFQLERGIEADRMRLQELLADRRAKQAEESLNLRLSRQDKQEQQREDKTLFRAQEADLQKQLKQAQSEADATRNLATILANQDDFSSKTLKKLEEKIPGVMGKAGVTPDQLASIEERAKEKGWIWDSIDKKKRNQLIQEELIGQKQNEIKNIRQALDELLKRPKSPGAQQPAATTPPSTPPASTGKIRVQKGEEILEIDPSDLPDAERDGYRRIN